MAEAEPAGLVTAAGYGNWREHGARRKKVYGYLKAANELRQSYQSQWTKPRDQGDASDEQGFPGGSSDVEIVRNGNEEMVLFPSYARKRVKGSGRLHYDKPGAHETEAHPGSSGDAEYWKRQWEQYEDDNAIVDVDVRGWVYTPHSGAITRRNRLVIAVARRLSGIPAPATSPGSSRDSSRHSSIRESFDDRVHRHEEEAAAREAISIIRRGEGEADAAWRGGYSKDTSKSPNGESPRSPRLSSPVTHLEQVEEPFIRQLKHTTTDSSLGSDSEEPRLGSSPKRESWNRPANMSREELARANSHLMARLKPFMHLPVAGAPITVFFFNEERSQSRSVNTNESGHFSVRASLDFVPTSLRVLASENLSATEKVIIIDPRGVSLISDIDDTIKHSAIAGGAKEIFYNTFIRELGDLTIKGVKEWYSRLATLGVQLHYVSNSPWQLYPLLRSYFALAGLPPGSFHLKQYSGMLQGIFEPAAERKKSSLDKIMRDFPERRFILVGDSGEADLEVYTDVVVANPGRILGVFIRDVTTAAKKEFFDQSTGHTKSRRITSAEDMSRQGTASELSAAPDARPLLPSRSSKPAPKGDGITSPAEDLIDIGQDSQEIAATEASYQADLEGLEPSEPMSPKPAPPTRPSKPLALRNTSNTQVRPTNHERSITKTSSRQPSPSAQVSTRTSGPPPKPRRPSTSIEVSPSHRAPFSSDRQNQARGAPSARPAPSQMTGHHRNGEEGYATSARRQIVSAYNTLPSARSLWSGSPHAADPSASSVPLDRGEDINPISPNQEPSSNLAIPRPGMRRNISTANRLSWGTTAGATASSVGVRDSGAGGGFVSGGDGGGGALAGSPYNKKEEVWRRRWARAEEVMRKEGVVLRTWRVGTDVMDECVALCERSVEEIGKKKVES